MEKKICTKCKEEKTLDKFLFRNKEEKTYHSACADCYKEIRRKSYLKNKQTTLDRNKRNHAKSREWFREYKGTLKCNRCPESHPATLDFHHVDSDEKRKNVSKMVNEGYSIKMIKGEIAKCEVLCANCHRKHHWNERVKLVKLKSDESDL